ncbi:hypothetical protein HNQ90_001908 [Algibacter amylolyticus]|nr:hypothetical protein [Algibacter amylolyticus]
MEDILIGIIKFFGNTIEDIVTGFKRKKALLSGFIILLICLIIVYFLTKDF